MNLRMKKVVTPIAILNVPSNVEVLCSSSNGRYGWLLHFRMTEELSFSCNSNEGEGWECCIVDRRRCVRQPWYTNRAGIEKILYNIGESNMDDIVYGNAEVSE